MSKQDDVRGGVCDILQRVKYVELGGSLYPLADEVIALVRRDERKRLQQEAEEYEIFQAVESMLCAHGERYVSDDCSVTDKEAAAEIIHLIRAARDMEIREALLSDGAVQAAYDALLNPHLADADMSHMPEVLQAVAKHIGLAEEGAER